MPLEACLLKMRSYEHFYRIINLAGNRLSEMKVAGREAMHMAQSLLVSGSIPLKKCNDFSTLMRVTAHVLKFIQALKESGSAGKPNTC